MTEAKAKASGRKIKVGRFPFIGNGKAIALGEADGLVKTVFDADTGELLGAHMIGAEVTELIHGYTIARTRRSDRGRTRRHDLPASDLVGDAARSRARRRQEGATYLDSCFRSAVTSGDIVGLGRHQPRAAGAVEEEHRRRVHHFVRMSGRIRRHAVDRRDSAARHRSVGRPCRASPSICGAKERA